MLSMLKQNFQAIRAVSLLTKCPVYQRCNMHTAHLDLRKRVLKIQWNEEETTLHPFIWLRDCCQCERCAHPLSQQRLVQLKNLDLQVVPQKVRFCDSNQNIKIIWEDGHISPYGYQWLIDRSFTPERQVLHIRKSYGPAREFWNGQHSIATYNYDDITTSESEIYDLLHTLTVWGIGLIHHAPCDRKALEDLLSAIGYPMTTMKTKTNMDTTELSSFPREIIIPNISDCHTTFPYLTVLPGLDFIHCIQQSGSSDYHGDQFVDGFFAAEIIRQNAPDMYNILSNTLIQFWEYGTDHLQDFRIMDMKPTILVDEMNTPISIAFNQSMRDSYLTIPLTKVSSFYEALKLFEKTVFKQVLNYKLTEGDIVIFDNRRVLHGRKVASESKKKVLFNSGSFLSWSEARSKLRRLKEKFDTAII